MDNHCPGCLLPGPSHESDKDCVAALKGAMVKQREAAQNLGLDISTRILAVLEQLASDPGSGLSAYSVRDPETGKPRLVPPQQVAGVFANIRHLYERSGEWSPMRDLREALEEWRTYANELEDCLGETAKNLPEATLSEMKRRLADLHPESKEPDLQGSKSTPG